MALVSFLSGGYNLHRFSDAIGLVINDSRLGITPFLWSVICGILSITGENYSGVLSQYKDIFIVHSVHSPT